ARETWLARREPLVLHRSCRRPLSASEVAADRCRKSGACGSAGRSRRDRIPAGHRGHVLRGATILYSRPQRLRVVFHPVSGKVVARVVHAPVTIERIGKDAAASDVRALAQLLVDAIDSGAGVSFLAGLTEGEAEAWWRSVLASSSERAIIL